MFKKHALSWVSMIELAVVGAFAPRFLFPSFGFRLWMMAIPLLFWGMRLVANGHLTKPTPLDIPILVISLMLAISMLVTFDPTLSLPKVAGIYYGIIVYFTVINTLSWDNIKRIVLPILLFTGFVIAGLSLFAMRWPTTKLPLIGASLTGISTRLPRLIEGIPRAEKGISSNQLGGTLILLIPLQAVLFIYSVQTFGKKKWAWVKMTVRGVILCLSLFVLLLTQSRGAIATALVVCSSLSLFYLRQKRWLIIIFFIFSLIFAGALIFSYQTDIFMPDTELEDISGSFSLQTRQEIWSRAYRMLQDHPFTGIGMDTFSKVLVTRYPTFILPLEKAQVIPHAHNLYLQTSLDLGIPGLTAFLALQIIVGWMLIRIIHYTHSSLVKTSAIGLLLGLGAQLIYGWVDCIALGQKPSIFNWIYLALSTIIYKTELESFYPEI